MADDRVRVLVEEALRAEDLDPAAATRDLETHQKSLAGTSLDDPDYELRRAKVERAAARAFVARRR